MTIYKTDNGYWRVSEIIDEHFVSRLYIGYTRKQAVHQFNLDKQSEVRYNSPYQHKEKHTNGL